LHFLKLARLSLDREVQIRADWIVSGKACNGEQAFGVTLERHPDILIADYSMPIMNGFEVSRRLLNAMHMPTEVLIMAMHESEELLSEAILAGTCGFLFKSDAREHLISVIEGCLKSLSATINQQQNRSVVLLTSREQSVVQLVAEGKRVRYAIRKKFGRTIRSTVDCCRGMQGRTCTFLVEVTRLLVANINIRVGPGRRRARTPTAIEMWLGRCSAEGAKKILGGAAREADLN
jgi:DNA-binding NarL/FixJ family response regulator